jgi:NADPH:quinone reductase-like Zn-dependent oxidoreductase
MKALVINGHGDLSCLSVNDIPVPSVAKATDVLIRVKSASLNHLDVHTLGGLPGLTLDFPHVLAGDGAGVIEEVGEGVTRVVPGDRVLINPGISCYACEFCLAGEHSLCTTYRLLGEHVTGAAAEFVVVPEQNVYHIPQTPPQIEDISWHEAAAFGLVTLTAWRMMITRARVKPGDVVLIWGIGGGVSSTAVQVSKLAGAFVIATSSSDEKLEKAKGFGADVTLNHSNVDVAREVRAITGKRGADVVLDNVGEATWKNSLRALAKQGRLVTCGGTSGPHVVTDVRRLFWNQYDIMGSTMGNASEFSTIVRLLGQGQLRPVIDSVFPLDDGNNALARMMAGEQMGKIVLEVSQ